MLALGFLKTRAITSHLTTQSEFYKIVVKSLNTYVSMVILLTFCCLFL